MTRSSAQTAADAAALAAARADRDGVHDAFLAALLAGDRVELARLLAEVWPDDGSQCLAADAYAGDNRATVQQCGRTGDSPPGYSVEVQTVGTVGKSVVKGTESRHALAKATAVVEPRCALGDTEGDAMGFRCEDGAMTVDPTADGFTLDLSAFYRVHLSQ